MVRIINPSAKIVDYGPKIVTESGEIIVPDHVVRRAGLITFKGEDVFAEMVETGKDDDPDKVLESIIRSTGSGHASLTTSEAFWAFIGGDCSKLVDSVFTTARYSSSLMPSGRRVPIKKENIVVPRSIADNPRALTFYLKTSETNIGSYEALIEGGVPKEEAAKVVQYGHKGGGFTLVPLETFIYFAKAFEAEPEATPGEAREIVEQLEKQVHKFGMGINYEARKAAPRATLPSPNIFTFRHNQAHYLTNEHLEQLVDGPILLDIRCDKSPERDVRIRKWLEKRDKVFSSKDLIVENWQELQEEIEGIVADHNNSFRARTLTLSPWRVWGEVKRHRTVPQSVESIYDAVDRILTAGDFSQLISIPPSVRNNPKNLKLWSERFEDSFRTYQALVDLGIPKRDAIMVVPRGIKVGIEKEFDLYNATLGYISLRLCKGTVEPEMLFTTRREADLILNSDKVSLEIKQLIIPKCGYGGFCPEDGKKYCSWIAGPVKSYDEDFHKRMFELRSTKIRERISNFCG